jgi:hypothetical protein
MATVGYTQSKGDVDGDGYFLKLDLNGDTLFTRTFGAQYKDFANDIVQKTNNDYVICGAKSYSLNAKTSSYMCSINQNGNFLWDNNYLFDASINEEFSSLCNVTYSPAYTTYIRNISMPGKNVQDLLAVCYPGGWVYLANDSGGDGDDLCYSVEATKDGGYIEVGTTNSFNALSGDVYFIKRDSTIISYQSIVGIRENALKNKGTKLIRINENQIRIELENHFEFRSLKINSIDGLVLSNQIIEENNFIKELDIYPKGILIFSFYTKSGELYNYKIIN